MRPVDEHRRAVLALVRPLEPVTLALTDADGLALASDVVAAGSLPPFDNSAMDGYAVRAAEVAQPPVTLPVAADVPAGSGLPAPLAPGTTVRIMTGAPVPEGADAVVPVESTDGGTTTVRVEHGVAAGANVRRAGEDVRAGDTVLLAGDEVTPARVGLLASLGHATVSVHRRPRVGVVSTGSELVPPGGPLPAGSIYDSNGPLLAALAARAGAEPVLRPALPDTPTAAAEVLTALAGEVDLLVTSGGISAGAYEVVKDVFGRDGQVEFARVAMQPGMPQGCGTLAGCPVLTLPGNPVSAFVSFEVFGRPAVRRLAGHRHLDRPVRRATLAEPVAQHPVKRQYRRATWDPDGSVRLVGGTGSHLMAALAQADALLVVPPGDGTLAAGSLADVVDLGG